MVNPEMHTNCKINFIQNDNQFGPWKRVYRLLNLLFFHRNEYEDLLSLTSAVDCFEGKRK